ncbi:unnamed protein product [Mytilus edulis]|uniref:Uncharacterized protein n=1 Tax=Mytilus edulis TaxID=6550 RepID=A0A8S3R787_MYTED|nr:unnamed protein product [Mytilus edulis]
MDNRKAIIASYKDEILQSIQFEKSEIKVEQEISKTKVFDMDIMPNGDILLSVEECELKLLKENEIAEHAPFHSFSPLKTFGVHINRENEIIVGISAGFPTEKDEVSKPGKIVVLNSKGSIKRKHEFEQDEYRNQLCVCPTRIVTNSENTICFIDIFKKAYYGDGYDKKINNKGRIVGIDQEGKVKWIYHGTGHQQSSSIYFLCPKDIAVINSAGCILIYDAPIKHFQTFHIISQDGSAIAYSDLRLTNLGHKLDDLGSLAIDKDQKLYVGSDETYRSAKIHIFEFI